MIAFMMVVHAMRERKRKLSVGEFKPMDILRGMVGLNMFDYDQLLFLVCALG